ncbi:MAG TPA: hypothetical protein ENL42_06050 [Thermoplasmatales archaeon]|nr:hypothetical protein [Thermoplasmatales archaeon]
MKEKIIVDVRTREEFVKEHIKGAINIPLYDIDFYIPFLIEREVLLYCDTGRRAEIAARKLKERGINAAMIGEEEVKEYEKEGKGIICAVNFVSVRGGKEKEFEESVEELCRATDEMPGFLGSKLLKVNGISAIGSGLPGELRNEEVKPTKYIILTYWESKETHDESHMSEIFRKAFEKMPALLSQMPYEEFYEVLR